MGINNLTGVILEIVNDERDLRLSETRTPFYWELQKILGNFNPEIMADYGEKKQTMTRVLVGENGKIEKGNNEQNMHDTLNAQVIFIGEKVTPFLKIRDRYYQLAEKRGGVYIEESIII